MEFSLNPSGFLDHSSSSKSDSLGAGEGLTGQVGTVLYVAPEVMDTTQKTHYNQVRECAKNTEDCKNSSARGHCWFSMINKPF